MNITKGCLIVSLALVAAVSHASDRLQIEKVKTGILPNGGFYSLYEVECRGQGTAAIASLDGKRRWCSVQDGAMSCFSSKQDASLGACMASALAATDGDLDEADKYQ